MDGFQEQTGLLKQVTAANGVTTKYEYDPFGRLFATYDAGADATGTGDDFVGFSNPTVYDGDSVERYRYWDTDWNYNGVTFLDPSGVNHQGVPTPFLISIEKRPGSYYLNPANSSNTGVAYNDQTFYDGFGRPIQTRSLWNWVEGQNLSREIISHTTYAANGQVNCQSIPYDVPFYSDQPKTWPTSPFYATHTCTSQPHTATTTDGMGRPLTITAPDGSTTNYSYYILTTLTADGRNRLALTNIEDANNHLIGQVTNSLGQRVIVQENSGTNPYTSQSRTWYTYDLMGNLTKVVTSDGDPSTNPTGGDILRQSTMSYDSLGRKTGMTDADMGSWSYAYDVAGNLISQVDANGQRLCFYYDALSRLTTKRHDSNNNGCSTTDTQLALYAYYAPNAVEVGERGLIEEIRWTASNTENKERFHYDNLGRLTNHVRWIDSRQYAMLYTVFDAFHRPHTTTYPNGQTITTEFDRQGEDSLTNGSTTLISDIRANALGQLTFLDRANGGADTTYLYHPATDASGDGYGDSNFRLKTIQHGGSGGTWPDFTYQYDLVGNITKLTTSSNGTDTQTFTYDHLNRLTDAIATGSPTNANYTHNTPPTDYEYDELGNIEYFGNTTLYDYTTWDTNCTNPPSQPMPHAVKQIGSQYFCYDKNGNMTKRYDGSSTYTQNFNVENELESVVVSSQTTSFTYDAAGLRVKTVQPNGTITDTPFPGYEVENPGSSQTVRLTFTIAGQAIALRVITSSSNTYYHLYNDHLGSLAAIGNSSGGLVSGSRAYYQPFGSYRGTAPTQSLTDRQFTSQKENLELGLYYYNARYYAPGVGRFISADTIVPNPQNPQSYNRYTYVLNSPLNFTDPSGHCEFGFDESGNPIITRFDCSFDEFEQLPIEMRLLWMQIFMRQVPGATDWFNNIVGIIEGFVEYGLAQPGSWLSIVDVGILQGIQDGYAQSADIATFSSMNPGAPLWKSFFDALNNSASEGDLINLWGIAEQAATNYGAEVAAQRGLSPNGYEQIFLQTGNLYRGAASAFEGGLGTPLSWVGAFLGVLSGSGEAVTSLDVAPIYTYGELGATAGFSLGSFFNDPRSLWNGHSPVYWYSTTLIWANQETHQWP